MNIKGNILRRKLMEEKFNNSQEERQFQQFQEYQKRQEEEKKEKT